MRGQPLRIETPRLILTSITLDDAADFHAVVHESMKLFSRWLNWAKPGFSLDDVHAFITKHTGYGPRICLPLLGRDKRTGKAVVFVQIHRRKAGGHEVGYWCHADHNGQGLTTEALNASVEHAFTELGVSEICAVCNPKNAGSVRAAQKVGFTLGVGDIGLGNGYTPDGRRCDVHTYRLSNEEFKRRRKTRRNRR